MPSPGAGKMRKFYITCFIIGLAVGWLTACQHPTSPTSTTDTSYDISGGDCRHNWVGGDLYCGDRDDDTTSTSLSEEEEEDTIHLLQWLLQASTRILRSLVGRVWRSSLQYYPRHRVVPRWSLVQGHHFWLNTSLQPRLRCEM